MISAVLLSPSAALPQAARPAGVLPTLPTTTLTLPTLPTTTLTLPTTTLPTVTTSTLRLPTTTFTVPTLPTTSTTVAGITTTTAPAPGGCGAVGCDDRNPCTEDRCDVAAGCRHEALSGPACDDGDPCTGGDRCIAGLCAGTELGCTQPPRCAAACPDDGFSCTDDVCTAAGCFHVPVDSRCVPAGACTSAACAPDLAGADSAGCVVGSPEPDGAPCAEDTDACTLDLCRDGACVHERDPDTTACAPLQAAFRETIALGALTGELLTAVMAEVPSGGEALVARLTTIQESLAAAERALAGDDPGPARSGLRPAAASSVPANVRARIAFTHLLRTPRDVSLFLEEVRRAQLRAAMSRTAGRFLRQGGRRLLNGTRALKAELRPLARGAATARSGRPRRRVGRREAAPRPKLPLAVAPARESR